VKDIRQPEIRERRGSEIFVNDVPEAVGEVLAIVGCGASEGGKDEFCEDDVVPK
jgi:hypothetical protein